MTKQVIGVGDSPNDGLGDPIRDGMIKVNENFTDLYDNYQSRAGLAANVITLTSNNTLYVGTVSAVNVVSNTQLQANLANYTNTAGLVVYQLRADLNANLIQLGVQFNSTLSANVVKLTSNLANYIVPGHTGIISNASGVYVNSAYVTSLIDLSPYQTRAGLAANVVTLTSNNAYYVNSKSEADLNVNNAVTSNSSNSATYANGSSTNAFSLGTAFRSFTNGNIGIANTAPAQKLVVAGTIESTSGGIKFPDSTVQTTAAADYTLPTASGSVLGGVKVGTGLSISSSTLSLQTASGSVLGGVKVGTGLSIDGSSILSVNPVGVVSYSNTFTSSGTWTKPAGYNASSRVFIQAWGGGGGGSASYAQAGAGGGGYNYAWTTLSALGATENIAVGTGGGVATGAGGDGGEGGASYVGASTSVNKCIAFGGGGGSHTAGYNGGGGGGQLSAGTSGLVFSGGGLQGQPGKPWVVCGGFYDAGAFAISTLYVQGGIGQSAFMHGGGGAGIINETETYVGGSPSVWGGGGGGSDPYYGGGTGGGSSKYAGAGGAIGVAGTAPAGGGGGGAVGARGEVRITVFAGV